MIITCCEIALMLGITNVISLAIFAGYNMRLDKRTVKLEKKNGHEQHQIDEIKQELSEVKKQLPKHE